MINQQLFLVVNNLAGKSFILNKIMIFLAVYSPFIIILILLCLWLKNRENKNIILYSIYSSILGILLNLSISLFYFHPRPFMENLGSLLISHKAETSFPSGHTTFMLSIAFIFLYFKKTRKLGIILSIFGFLVGVARVFVGVHFPFDIAGSFVVSIIASYLIFSSRNRLNKLNKLIISLYLKIKRKN